MTQLNRTHFDRPHDRPASKANQGVWKALGQFQLCTYKRLVDIYSNSAKTVDALMKLELSSGVNVEIKL